MKIRILGTAASEGIPGLFCSCEVCRKAYELGGKNIRTRSQSIINDKYIVDFPPDTYMHILRDKLDLAHLSHLIVTHAHDDHFYPADLQYRRPPFAYNLPPLTVYGSQAVAEKYREFRNVVREQEIDDYVRIQELQVYQAYDLDGLKVIPLLALHDRRMDCFIYIFEADGKRLLYGHDTGFFPSRSMEFVKQFRFDCVIFDCTTGLERDGNNHMGIEDNLQLRDELADAGCIDDKTILVMSHFSHNGGLTHDQVQEIAEKNGFLAAYDGMEIDF